ncbi:MAG: archease [candidate division WOR-3 bacterium]
MGYRLINPKADIGIEVWGNSVKELFEESVRALIDLYSINKKSVAETKEITVSVEGIDLEDLLVSVLNQVIFLVDAKKFIPIDVKVEKLNDTKVTMTLKGEDYKEDKDYGIEREIKAATFHNLKIEKEGNLVKTRIIFDV